jgi:hypothetical protein
MYQFLTSYYTIVRSIWYRWVHGSTVALSREMKFQSWFRTFPILLVVFHALYIVQNTTTWYNACIKSPSFFLYFLKRRIQLIYRAPAPACSIIIVVVNDAIEKTRRYIRSTTLKTSTFKKLSNHLLKVVLPSILGLRHDKVQF